METPWTAFVQEKKGAAGRWSHHFYRDGYPAGPRACPDDRKKRNQYRLRADTDALCEGFPGTEKEILEAYFRSDFEIRTGEERWAQSMARRYRQKGWMPPPAPPVRRVRPSDRYLSDDWRQVYSLMDYLSFPLEDALNAAL